LILTASFEFVVHFIGISLTLFNMAVIAGFLRQRRRDRHSPRPFRAPFGVPASILFLLINGWMVIFLAANDPLAVGIATGSILLALLVGWPLRHHAPLRPVEPPA
jgi:APA family basic amino acid/polyamine antiporter